MSKTEIFILKWVAVLFIFTVIVYIFFAENKYTFIAGLFIGTFLSVIKFRLNAYNFFWVLSMKKAPNNILLVVLNLFWLFLFFMTIYLIYIIMGHVDINTMIGIFVGVSYIPVIIIISGILESLYIIKNKL